MRLAFVVDKPDLTILEEVFSLNTLLWGGLFNPVVVLDGSKRKQVGMHYNFGEQDYEGELLSLLKEFDPDILVNYSNVPLSSSFEPFKLRIIARDDIRWNPWGSQEITFFMEVWPFLHRYWRQEVRFLQKPNQRFGYVDLNPSGELRTYLIARYGSYPAGTDGNILLEKNFGGSPVSYDQEFRLSFVASEWLFPLGITTFELDAPSPSVLGRYIFFLMDPTNAFDLVDFWNLRAAGFRVFALPLGHYQDFAKSAKPFAELAAYRINTNVMSITEIVKSRSVEDSQLQEAGKWIGSLGAKTEMISLKAWVPRFGEESDLKIRQPLSNESSEIVVLNDGTGTLKGPLPDCEFDGPSSSQHWATELRFLGSIDEESTYRLPWLHPECDGLANRKVGHGFGTTCSRVSRQGIVVIRRGDDEDTWIQAPMVTEVLQAYLKDAGFEYSRTSSPGLALKRIIEQLGSLHAGALFQRSGVRQIIEELVDGSPMHSETVRKMIYKSISAPENERQKTFEAILGQLVSTRILRQGLRLQCDKCQRHEWYHLSELGEEFKCKKCFHLQLVPHLDKRPWYYVTDGLFRLEGKTGGCLTALLSLVFLKVFLKHEMKYSSSFDYLDGSDAAERDFAVFSSDSFRDDVDVIIGECKTSKELEEKQKQDTKNLGARTGAYLAFATLSSEFTKDDRTFFGELVESRIRPILLTRKHMEMSYLEVLEYHRSTRWQASDAEILSRLTIAEVLGKEFANKHRLWI